MKREANFTSFSEYRESVAATAITEETVRAFITGKAAGDEAFRKALVTDPGAVIEAEIGIQLPQGLKLRVHEETNDELHMVLPAPMELTAAQLGAVTGGWPTGPQYPQDDALWDPDGGVDHDN